jgi:molybdate transport repressor ModE-like protein
VDIELYRTFLAIYDSGSFTAAARHAGRTQSAASQQIRKLEETLGHPLFERRTGAVLLTEYGKSLIGYARSIVETHAEVMSAFTGAEFDGVVAVGVADAYVNRIHLDVATEFARLYPAATLNVVIDDSLALSRRIAEGSIDLAFVTEGNCPTRGPVAFRDRVVVVGPSAVNLAHADPLPLAVWDERNQDEVPLIALLRGMGRSHRVAYVCRSVNAQHAAIAAGLCVGVLIEGSMIAGERAYLEADGFPVLKEVAVRLERSRARKSQAIDRLERHYLDFFARAPATEKR